MIQNYYYNMLDNIAEQRAYNDIYNTLLLSGDNFNPGIKEQETLLKIQEFVVLDHPELINFAGLFIQGGKNSSYADLSSSETQNFQQKLTEIAQNIEKNITKNSEYEITRAIYEYLANLIEYDYEVLNEYSRLISENASNNRMQQFIRENFGVFTPYNVVNKKVKMCCMGISKLFKMLCDMFNIDCICINATEKENKITHTFNMVQIEGEKYYVDITNGLKREDINTIMYNYFLVPSKVMDEFYEIKYITEKLTLNKNNYFVKNNIYFTRINDMRKYLEAYTATANDGIVRCWIDKQYDQEKLQNIALEVLQYHCEQGKGAYVVFDNGFLNARIKWITEGN